MSPKDNLDNLKTGGEILVDCLKINGVEKVFCVPGESYLSVIDAMHDVANEIKLVSCRQEGGPGPSETGVRRKGPDASCLGQAELHRDCRPNSEVE